MTTASDAGAAEIEGRVTTLTPLYVRGFGSTTAVPALMESGLTLVVGARVRMTVRDPLPPIVTGVVT